MRIKNYIIIVVVLLFNLLIVNQVFAKDVSVDDSVYKTLKNSSNSMDYIKREQQILKTKENNLIIKYKNTKKHINNNYFNNSNIEILQLNENENIESIILELKNNPDIKSVEKDEKLYILEQDSFTINDPFYNQQWYLDCIKIPKVWQKLNTNLKTNPIVIAVIDTGIETTHEEFKNKIHPEGYNFILNNDNIYDIHGHGTNVSGVICAETNNFIGIAGIVDNLDVKILPLQAASNNGTLFTSDVIKAIDYAIKKNVDVINMSIGVGSYSETLNETIQKAVNKGIIVIAGAGNKGINSYNYPASYDNVISVGSIDENKNISYFSNYNDKVDIVVPGENIYTTNINNSYKNKGGTSFSTAIVSGVVAILKSVESSLTSQEIYNILTTTAEDRGELGKDDYYGYGVVNTLNAINNVIVNDNECKIWETQYDVINNKIWTIKLNMLIDDSTVNNNVYILDENKIKLDQVILTENDKIIIYPPSKNYINGKSYNLYIKNNIKSKNGKQLINPIRMEFIIKN